jgi:type I restriction-modification system DNA methylase subunit
MINKDNLKALLLNLHFQQHGNQFSKQFNNTHLAVDFDKNELIYPEDQGLKIHERQTCNFSASENFVVFECVHRLLEKGYKPEHIELEPKWKVGHGASGGRADILVTDNDNNALLIIECKTAGKELDRAWDKTRLDGGQLFSYVQQQRSVKFICLYASDFKDEKLNFNHYIITVVDIQNEIEKDINKEIKRLFYKDTQDVKQLYQVWRETYHLDYQQSGLFEADVQAYNIGKQKLTLKDLKVITKSEMKGKYNEFAEILRTYAASGKEGAFDKLINLFLCKIVDEKQSHVTGKELDFYWKGEYFDDYFSLIDRLQKLYKEGMEQYLGEKITYIDNQKIIAGFCYFKQDKNATQDYILSLFKEQKYFTNSDFGFIDVHNDKLFYQNAAILLDIVRMWQHYQLSSEQQHQFLGDMFEFFLDKGFKQSEGQFFTPIPICKFILQSLPLEQLINANPKPPRVIDYACGSGHFLTEYASQIKPFIQSDDELKKYYQAIFGVEKEYRLSKVAKISAFMYGQDDINVIYCDALNTIQQEISGKIVLAEEETFDILVANPPFAVDGFLTTLPQDKRGDYTLFNKDMDIKTQNNIQCFFIERAAQLLAPNGIAAIVVPSSVLSNSDATHIGSREILLKYFDIVALVELGSGTFGKTGTTTVVLFLRRKHKRPTEADQYFNRVNDWFDNWQEEFTSGGGAYNDIHFVEHYCEHICVDFAHYHSLLNGEPSAELLAAELFVDYRNEFDKTVIARNLMAKYEKQLSLLAKTLTNEIVKQQKAEEKKLTAQEIQDKVCLILPEEKEKLLAVQTAELNAKFLVYLQTIEKEKLYYFILAFTNPQKVLVIKSPSDNKELKAFLGYGWSDRKGAEGIQLITDSAGNHLTPLYDVTNRNNPEKISFLIAQNFLGNALDLNLQGLEDLAGLVTTARLVDILDFSRKDFNKVISLTAKKSLIVETKWDLVKLGDVADIQSGGTPSSEIAEYWDGDICWATLVDTKNKYLTNTQRKITETGLKNSSAKLLPINTVIFSSRATIGDVTIAKIETATNQGYKNFICNEKIGHEYLYYILKYYANEIASLASGMTFKEISKTVISNFKIPLPPTAIQQQIVIECESVDKEVQTTEQSIKMIQGEIEETVKNTFISTNYQLHKLDSLMIIARGASPRPIQDYLTNDKNGVNWIKIGDVKQGVKYITQTEEKITPEGAEKSRFVKKGDFILSNSMSAGRPYILKISGCIHDGWLLLSEINESLDKDYFYYILAYYDAVKQQLTDNALGGTVKNLNIDRVKTIKIPVPDIEIQKTLVAEIEQLENKIAASQKIINEAASKKQAVLNRYL